MTKIRLSYIQNSVTTSYELHLHSVQHRNFHVLSASYDGYTTRTKGRVFFVLQQVVRMQKPLAQRGFVQPGFRYTRRSIIMYMTGGKVKSAEPWKVWVQDDERTQLLNSPSERPPQLLKILKNVRIFRDDAESISVCVHVTPFPPAQRLRNAVLRNTTWPLPITPALYEGTCSFHRAKLKISLIRK